MVDRSKIEQLVKEKLLARTGGDPNLEPLDFVNEQHVRSASQQSSIPVTADAIITSLARDVAESKGIKFQIIAHKEITISNSFNPKSIAIGSDHGGFELKQVLVKELKKWGYDTVDVGTHSKDSVDYPDLAYAVANMVSTKTCIFGIAIDGAGIGSAMVANKVNGIRAAHCHNIFEIKNSKEHNNANVLTLGARVIGEGLAIEMVRTWLETPFAGGRHQRRVDKITAVETKNIKE